MDNYQNLDPIKKLETAADLFLRNVQGTRSLHTFTAYRAVLSDFIRFFSESTGVNGSDPGFVAVMAFEGAGAVPQLHQALSHAAPQFF